MRAPVRPMKLAFVSGKLGGGGAERAVADMATYWAQLGHDVTVLTYIAQSFDPPDYPLDPSVTRIRISMGSRSGWRFALAFVQRLVALRRALRRAAPDVVISMVLGANISALIATAGTGIPVIGEQVNTVEESLRLPPVRLLRWLLYRRLYAFVIQSRRLSEAAARIVGDEKVHVIPRHVSLMFSSKPDTTAGSLWEQFPGERTAVRIVGVGRLAQAKGFDVLLRAVARLPTDADWSLVVLGDGPERAALDGLAGSLGIGSRVWFPGWSPDPRPTLAASTLFVLPSRYEGWPNALLEAMAWGLPVIAADCPNGPGEIITDGVDGLLVGVEDVDGLAAAVQKLIDDPDLRARLASAAPSVRQRFSIERITAMWEALFPVAGRVRSS